jgi:AcrR family transcriptional regulator
MGRRAGVTPAETRERLVEAAARVFQLKGYEGATVALIAQEAGVTSGAIYAHYPNKAALLVDALRANRERVTATLFPPGTRADAADLLVTLGRRLGRRDDPTTELLAEAVLAARRDQELADVLVDALGEREAAMAALLRRGQDDGSLAGGFSPAAGARFALMLSLGSMLVHALGLPAADRDEWADVVARFVGGFTSGTGAAPDPPGAPVPNDHENDHHADAGPQEGNQ